MTKISLLGKMAEVIRAEDLVRFGNLELLARKVVEGFITGLHKSPYHGFSVEFAEHRPYNPGESIRHMDWKLYGRTDKLFVKRFEDETNLRSRIVVDVSASMYYPFDKEPKANKYAFSALAAASLGYLLHTQRDAVGLSLVDHEVRVHTPARSSYTHLRYLVGILEQYLNAPPPKPGQPTRLAQHLHEIADKIHSRSLVIVFSDFWGCLTDDDPLKKALAPLLDAIGHLIFCKHDVILFHVLDIPSELQLDLENRPYEFEDSESGEKIRLNPVEIQEVYRQQADAFARTLRMEATQLGAAYHAFNIAEPLEKVLMDFMISRNF